MKKTSRAIIAVFLAALIAMLLPIQVFADTPDYISEIKIGMGKTAEEAKASLEGYTVLDADLNQDAGGGLGSKGEKAVYIGYKTTKDRSEAVTDLALMNMKGGYSVKDYEILMETQMKAQIIPLVDSFLETINEYRANYISKNKKNKQRARYIHDVLNKFTDDDTGKGLGDLLLNETAYEKAKPIYNALSAKEKETKTFYDVNKQVVDSLPEAEKKECADILTIIAQSNGKATLLMQNLITRAADTNDNTWLERFSEITYDDLIEATGKSPTDAAKQIAKLYDDDANTILDSWSVLYDELMKYDEYTKFVKTYDDKKLSETEKKLKVITEVGSNASEEEVLQAYKDYNDALEAQQKLLSALKAIMIHDSLEETEYGNGTMLDFFTQSYDEVSEDVTVLYPLVASFSNGQKAGLEFISLEEIMMIALTDEGAYSDTELDELEELSIYNGVDRSIYEKDAVALTSDAIRADFAAQVEEENSEFSPWTIAMWAVTGAMAACAITSAILSVSFKAYSKWCSEMFKELSTSTEFEAFASKHVKVINLGREKYFGYETFKNVYYDELYATRSTICKWLSVGFTVAMVVVAAVSVYLTYEDLQAQYKVDFTPIPRYIVDEKDLIGYNKKGEKIILKNQSAYYKAVECNRTEADEFFSVLGTLSDLNGDVGKQWLALYAVKNEAMEPILASSLKAVVGDAQMPAGYKTGVHMFGSDAAFNLNSSLYDWNNEAPATYVYFKTDENALSAAGSVFMPSMLTLNEINKGTLVLATGGGLILGAAVTAIAGISIKKRKKNTVHNA